MKTFQSSTPLTQPKELGKPYARSFRPSQTLTIYSTHLHKLLKKAFDELPIDLKNAMKLASNRIKSFHEKQKLSGFDYVDEIGVNLGLKYSPIKRVGFYTPGGKALYPSSVLMNVVPALVAGVEERVLVSPIYLEKSSEILLAAAYLAEVTEFY